MLDWMEGLGEGVLSYFWDEEDGVKYENIVPLLTAYAASRAEDSDTISGFLGLNTPQPTGYMGGIPDYTYKRELVPNAFTSNERDNAGAFTPANGPAAPRRPGSAGRRYFTDGVFAPTVAATAEDAEDGEDGEDGGDGEDIVVVDGVAINSSTGQPVVLSDGAITTTEGTDSEYTELAGGGLASFAGGGQPSGSAIGKYRAAYDLYQARLQNASTPEERAEIEAFWKEHLVNYDPAVIAASINMRAARNAPSQASQAPPPQRQRQRSWDWKNRRPTGHAGGGLASLKSRGYYLGGRTDGMADQVPATIDQKQPARLSDGEFVVPADVVSHLGNGSSNAGADQLFSMMDRVRKARTGRKSQGKEINPQRYLG